MAPLYRLDHIRHHYNGHTVLSIDRWTLSPGSITGLVGANGCGKSTLLKILGFVERPAAGEILFNSRRTTPLDDAARRHIALLPQESYLLKRTVYANVAYGLRIRKDRPQERERVEQALEWVGLPADTFARRPWFALSGGEARRVALAARLILHPQVLLLDEPTTSVDGASAQRMKAAALYAHRQWGTSLIIASHDLPWLHEICDDVIHIFAGRILGVGLQTLLFGPWLELEAGRVAMPLTDLQRFVALRPADQAGAAVAAIDPRRLTLLPSDQAPSEAKEIMEGIVTSLTLDKRAGGIDASVTVGHTEFRVHLPAEHPALAGLAPGRPARIAYAPDEVRWYS
ncbi:MAG: ABC transporter ATP-binding protein [Desulfobacterales bacterium]|nr:ABC transporter ATP-binding protein [Desulfobacterales bacterium]